MKSSEAMEQEAVIAWADCNEVRYPELRWLHAVPNGGKRSPRTGAMLKKQGVKKGIPDLYLPCARGPYHGLYIEMKYGRNRLTQEQQEFQTYALTHDYLMVVCYKAADAIEEIREYLNL